MNIDSVTPDCLVRLDAVAVSFMPQLSGPIVYLENALNVYFGIYCIEKVERKNC